MVIPPCVLYKRVCKHPSLRINSKFLTVNNPARRRITLGSTLTYQKKFLKTAIRLNYEKYFYDSNVNAPVGESDKIVAELVVKF